MCNVFACVWMCAFCMNMLCIPAATLTCVKWRKWIWLCWYAYVYRCIFNTPPETLFPNGYYTGVVWLRITFVRCTRLICFQLVFATYSSYLLFLCCVHLCSLCRQTIERFSSTNHIPFRADERELIRLSIDYECSNMHNIARACVTLLRKNGSVSWLWLAAYGAVKKMKNMHTKWYTS